MPIQSTNPPELITLNLWKGLNQQARRGTIDDEEEYWNENLFAIGPGNLRSCWGHGPAIYTAPPGVPILRIFFGYYGNNTAQFAVPPPGQKGWMFLANGHIDEVDLATQAVTSIPILQPTVTGTAITATSNTIDFLGTSGTINMGATLVFAGVLDPGLTVVNQTIGTPGGDGRYDLSKGPVDLSGAQVQFYEVGADGTGTSTGTHLITMTGVTGTINIGAVLSLAGVQDTNLVVVGQQSGTVGGDGVYTLSLPTSLSAAEIQFYENAATSTGTTANPNSVTITGVTGTITNGLMLAYNGHINASLTVSGQQSGAIGGNGIYLLNGPSTFLNTPVGFFATDVQAIWNPIAPQYWASAKVWRPQFVGNTTGQGGGVLFGSPKGLYAWDGTTLSSPGDPAPDWLTNAAEQPNPVAYTMPVGLPGIYAMEVYQSRLFVAGKDVISFSAPSNGADFSTTDGGGSFGYFGDKLTYSYMDLAESTGYLFVFGDSSIDMIANVQLTGQGTPSAPFITNLNYQNIDPQVGQRFPRPVGRIGRYFQMFNGAGIFQCRGAEASEIGNKIINVYNTLDTSVFMPTMASATMFGFKVLLCNGHFTDPFGVKRSLLLMWHPVSGNEFWSVASQNLELQQIGSYEQDSIITPYGTDGYSLYQLFAQPDPTLIKRLATKYIRGQQLQMLTIKNFKRLFMELYDNDGRGVSFTGNFTTGAGGVPSGSQDIGFAMPAGQNYAMLPQPIEAAGIAGALDIQSFSPDFTLERIHCLSEERTLYGA